uniref:Uncharacterized protein n=1 Tax=Arundo donax TaxID=35708 RepID=A0A0A9BIV5_ARUDO
MKQCCYWKLKYEATIWNLNASITKLHILMFSSCKKRIDVFLLQIESNKNPMVITTLLLTSITKMPALSSNNNRIRYMKKH